MPVFLLKSFISLAVLPLALLALYTMLELFGREEPRFGAGALKKIHRANGILYILVFSVVAFYCLSYVFNVKAELSARASLHAAVAIAIAVLLALKISFVRFYRRFYPQAKALGFAVAAMSFVLFGLSGGYYLLVTGFGAEIAGGGTAIVGDAPAVSIGAGADSEGIARGKDLYESKCIFCHDPYSNETIVGPGHKEILKNPMLPVSGRPAVPGNVRRQLMTPYRDMPPFDHLSEDEVADIIAFLNTL
jgi:mono/diheme cytochrome c family protein